MLTEEIKYSNMILSFKERHNHWELSEESRRKMILNLINQLTYQKNETTI